MTGTEKPSPLMRLIKSIKDKYPDALLLFEVNGFYEIFGSDAIKASEVLDIALAKRPSGLELAGFKASEFDKHIKKLVKSVGKVVVYNSSWIYKK